MSSSNFERRLGVKAKDEHPEDQNSDEVEVVIENPNELPLANKTKEL